MIVAVGSTNPVKCNAVQDSLVRVGAPLVSGSTVTGYAVKSNVSEQPKSLDEMFQGAVNRAQAAWALGKPDLAVGIESGVHLITCPTICSRWYDSVAVAVLFRFPGTSNYRISTGLSSGFVVPGPVVTLILTEGLRLSDAYLKAGLTQNPELGKHEGAASLETGGWLNRRWQISQALVNALGGDFPRIQC